VYNIENVTINGREAYLETHLSVGYVRTHDNPAIIKVKNKLYLKNVSFKISTGMKLELDNVTMANSSFEFYYSELLSEGMSDHAIIRDTTVSRSTCFYISTKPFDESGILMDKSYCIESNVTNTMLVNTRISQSNIKSLHNNHVLNTVTIFNSKLEIVLDLFEKFILDTSQFEESYEIIQERSTGELGYVYKKYGDEDTYTIRPLDSDYVFTGEKLVVKRRSLDKMLREGWMLVRDRMVLTYELVKGIHSGKRPVEKTDT
jgi:hypothetical protein